ncbi:MAG: four helix bundle protein [Patescibacteria group bacterium]
MKSENFKIVFKQRLYKFVIKLIKELDSLPRHPATQIFINQLIRSSTSVLANCIEAQAASSRKDFTNFIHYSLKSANESKVWVSILKDTNRMNPKTSEFYLQELKEISNILGSSIITLKKHK